MAGNRFALFAVTLACAASSALAQNGRLIVGAGSGGGFVRVFSPVAPPLNIDPPAVTLGGVRVAAGDVNGDGIPDIVTGSGPGGGPVVRVFDGTTNSQANSFFAFDAAFTGGITVAAGDLDGDGRADIIAGAGVGSQVKAFSGANGSLLRSFFAYGAFQGGVNVAAGDLDGDGRADVITGAGAGGAPHVKAFSGQTGLEIRSFFAFPMAFEGGVNVAGGDLNGDGFAEIVVGAADLASTVRVFDGSTGQQLTSFFAFDGFAGGVRVGVGDIDGDGFNELITGAGPGGGAHVRVFNGQSFAQMQDFFAFGTSVGDVWVAGTPIPAPSAVVLLAGAACMVARRRR